MIDSKVSFTAYLDYCNAEDEVSRENALGRHIESVRAHIKELSRKDYSHGLSKGDKESLKYVINNGEKTIFLQVVLGKLGNHL